MKKIVCILIFTLCFCAFFASDLNAQGKNSISGFIFGDSRIPVANVYIELVNDGYSIVARSKTNGSGLYNFRGLAEGQYVIKVLALGTDYEEQSASISLLSPSRVVGMGAVSEQVDFYLKKRKNANPLGAPGVVFVQEIPDDARKMYEAGAEELNDKKDSGLEKLKKAVEIFPNYFMALERLGNEYLSRNSYAEASAFFIKAIAVNPKSFPSTFGTGLASFRLNQFDEAGKYFKKSVDLSKESINAHLWLGITQHSKNDLSDALNSMLEANKLSQGKSSEVHWQLARVYKDQKKFQKSADELELFLKYNPTAKNSNEIKQVIKVLREKKDS